MLVWGNESAFAQWPIGLAKNCIAMDGGFGFFRGFLTEFQQGEVGTPEKIEEAEVFPQVVQQRGVWCAVPGLQGGGERRFAPGLGSCRDSLASVGGIDRRGEHLHWTEIPGMEFGGCTE
jgi:hypothetical protein